jgi:hypothetical protein
MVATGSEPLVVVAVVKAAGGVISKLIEVMARREGGESATKADDTVKKTYGLLQTNVSTGSLVILLVMRAQEGKLSEGMIRERAAPHLPHLADPHGRYEDDLVYRMRFLSTLGLVGLSMSEWMLTPLGFAFIERARADPNFQDAFRLDIRRR